MIKLSLILCLGFSAQFTWAQSVKVSVNGLELTHQTDGWMVTHPGSHYGALQLKDVITTFDGTPAAATGPLLVVNIFSESFVRPVHLSLSRAGAAVNVQLKSVEDSKGPLKSHMVAASGFRAPRFKTHDLSGRPVSLSSFGPRWVLLAFGATWCTECVGEIAELKHLQEQHPKDLAVVMLALDDKEDKLRALAAKQLIEYQVVNLGGLFSPVPIEYGVSSPKGTGELPTDFLIRPDRSIAYVQMGAPAGLSVGEQVQAIMEQPLN